MPTTQLGEFSDLSDLDRRRFPVVSDNSRNQVAETAFGINQTPQSNVGRNRLANNILNSLNRGQGGLAGLQPGAATRSGQPGGNNVQSSRQASSQPGFRPGTGGTVSFGGLSAPTGSAFSNVLQALAFHEDERLQNEIERTRNASQFTPSTSSPLSSLLTGAAQARSARQSLPGLLRQQETLQAGATPQGALTGEQAGQLGLQQLAQQQQDRGLLLKQLGLGQQASQFGAQQGLREAQFGLQQQQEQRAAALQERRFGPGGLAEQTIEAGRAAPQVQTVKIPVGIGGESLEVPLVQGPNGPTISQEFLQSLQSLQQNPQLFPGFGGAGFPEQG